MSLVHCECPKAGLAMSESVTPIEAPAAPPPDGADRMTEAPVATLVVGPIPLTESPPAPIVVEPSSASPPEAPSPKTDATTDESPKQIARPNEENGTAPPAANDHVAPPEAIVVPPVATILEGSVNATSGQPPAPAAIIAPLESSPAQYPEQAKVVAVDGPVPQMEALEYRVRRLENTVATLQDTRLLEDRVSERIANRLSRKPGKTTMREKASVIIDVGRKLLPLAAEKPEPTLSQSDASAASSSAHAAEPPAQSIWLLYDIYSEGLAILRMFIDPHYKMPWRSRLIPMILFVAILTSWFWLPGTAILEKLPGGSLVGTLLDKVVDLILAFFLFKILGREAKRYQQTFPSLAAKLRP